MTARATLIAIAAAALAGCSSLLGLNKEPSLTEPIDAAIDMKPADMMIDMDTSPCAGMPCGVFGCDIANNMCRPAKLWVFMTSGAFAANGFGGIDNTVRPTADGKCVMSLQDYPNRACSPNRTRAILTVNSADPIASMATLYGVPTTVEVHRIDDDVLVFNNWNDLTGMQAPRAFFASATAAPTDADGVAWTGFGGATASNCSGWTTNAAAANGVIGHAVGTKGGQNTWLGSESFTCNQGPLQRLLCVCWSGGN